MSLHELRWKEQRGCSKSCVVFTGKQGVGTKKRMGRKNVGDHTGAQIWRDGVLLTDIKLFLFLGMGNSSPGPRPWL